MPRPLKVPVVVQATVMLLARLAAFVEVEAVVRSFSALLKPFLFQICRAGEARGVPQPLHGRRSHGSAGPGAVKNTRAPPKSVSHCRCCRKISRQSLPMRCSSSGGRPTPASPVALRFSEAGREAAKLRRSQGLGGQSCCFLFLVQSCSVLVDNEVQCTPGPATCRAQTRHIYVS